MSIKVRLNFDKLLKENELTQKEFSELSGIRPAALSHLTRGFVDRISIDHLERVANALDIKDMNKVISYVNEEEEDSK